MLFPEWLYRLNVQDQGKQVLSSLLAEEQFNSSSTSFGGTIFIVPLDQVLIFAGGNNFLTPGAGQNATLSDMRVADPEANRQWIIARGSGAHLNVSGPQIFIPPGYRVRVSAVFDSGVNSNEIIGTVFGVLVPRGSFSFRTDHP